jgi:hypothetical protein
MPDNDPWAGIAAKGRAALQDAVDEAGGDFDLIDFERVREQYLSSLTGQERARVEAIEAELEQSGELGRVDRNAVEYLENLGARGVPPVDPVH